MQPYFNSVAKKSGPAMVGVSVTVTNATTGALATIYSDNGVATQANPMTTDASGKYGFYAADGRYTLTFSGATFTTFTQPILLEDPADSPSPTTAALAASGGAALIGHIASGTGAVATTAQAKMREVKSIGDRGALSDGATDDSAAIQLAANEGPFYVPRKTVRVDTAITGAYRWWSAGGDFNGTHPLDENFPAFGPGALRGVSVGGNNAIIGIAHNTQPASTTAFPTGATGYGRTDNAGNTAFGLFGRADLYNTGVATNEVNSFNFFAAASSSLPPDRSIGTAQKHPVALTVAAGGDYSSSIGVHICREGGSPQKFLTGVYVAADGVETYGIFVDADSGSTQALAALLKHKTGAGSVQVQGVGAVSATNAWLTYVNGVGATTYSVKEDGSISTSGQLGVGVTPSPTSGAAMTIGRNITGNTDAWAVLSNGVVQSDVTNSVRMYATKPSLMAASFNITNLQHFRAEQGTFGAGATVTTQIGYFVQSAMTGATNNYAFYGDIASGAGRYNIYMNGTAANYLAGELGIGIAASSSTQLALAASTTAKSSVRIAHGAAPTSPVDGDMWTTTAGMFVRINGVTKTVTLI